MGFKTYKESSANKHIDIKGKDKGKANVNGFSLPETAGVHNCITISLHSVIVSLKTKKNQRAVFFFFEKRRMQELD